MDNLEETYTECEARAWLDAHPDEFAADRWGQPGDLVQFVDTLYARGAAHVGVLLQRGEQMASLIRVTLPAEPGARSHLFALLRTEEASCGQDFSVEPSGRAQTLVTEEMAAAMGDPELEGSWLDEEGPLQDAGQDAVTLWWD